MTNEENYTAKLMELFSYDGSEDTFVVDMLREQMIDLWYVLTLEERKRMDELVELHKKNK